MSHKSKGTLLRYLAGSLVAIFCQTGIFGTSAENYPQNAALEEEMEQSMQALYAFDFFEADRLTADLVAHFPRHYLSHFTRAQYFWWMIITHPADPLLEKAYFEALGLALSSIKPLLGREPSHPHTFYFINIYAMQARLFLKNKEYLRTVFSLKSCVDQIEAALGKEQAYPPFYLSSGMYNYMSEYAREKLPFLALYTLLYPRGDRALGLSQLQTAAQSEHFIWRTEATYLLMKIYHELEQEPGKANRLARNLCEDYPENLIFRMESVKILESLGESALAVGEKEALIQATRKAPGISERQRSYLLETFGE